MATASKTITFGQTAQVADVVLDSAAAVQEDLAEAVASVELAVDFDDSDEEADEPAGGWAGKVNLNYTVSAYKTGPTGLISGTN